jgi:hypothetical protein
MKFSEWIDKETVNRRMNRTQIIRELSEVLTAKGLHISIATLSTCDRGARIKSYWRAKALSDATGGAVSVPELCE